MAKRKKKHYSLWRRIHPNRKYKDRLFQRIFADKKDLSFIISSSLNLYEHQSTFNPNMPMRGLLYFARLYEAYIEKYKLNIYGEKRISLPVPQYIVFYNGQKKVPEESLLRLSDMFVPTPNSAHTPEPMLECTVRVYNINPGYNNVLLSGCRRLRDYSCFIAEISGNLNQGMSLEDAIFTAMDTCVKQDVLADILIKNRSEVYQMLLTKYDAREVLEATYQDGLADGRAEELERVNHLNRILLEQNRIEDVKRAAVDSAYQQKLFQEFGI